MLWHMSLEDGQFHTLPAPPPPPASPPRVQTTLTLVHTCMGSTGLLCSWDAKIGLVTMMFVVGASIWCHDERAHQPLFSPLHSTLVHLSM